MSTQIRVTSKFEDGTYKQKDYDSREKAAEAVYRLARHHVFTGQSDDTTLTLTIGPT